MQKIKADKEQQNLKRKETVSALETTDTTGKKTTILFGADENTVEMRSGRTLAQEYMGVLKTLGKEHVSTNGADISVSNGVEARLIGAEIQGNTKRLDANGNECEAGAEGARLVSTEACISNNGIKYPFYEQYIKGSTVVQKRAKGSQNAWVTIPQNEVRDTVANEYRLYSASGLGSVPGVEDTVDLASGVKTDNTKDVVLNGSEVWGAFESRANTVRLQTGISFAPQGIVSHICDNLISREIYSLDEEGLQFSNGVLYMSVLKSRLTTQDVNGFKQWLAQNPITVRYQLATPTTTKLIKEQLQAYAPYKKQILLPFAEDKVTLNSDGSATWVNASELIDASKLDWRINSDVLNNVIQYSAWLYTIKSKPHMNCFSEGTFSVDGECFISVGSDFYIRIDKQFDTVEKLKLELERRNAVILYEKKEFNTITVPKEVNEPITTTDKINIFSAGEAVKPSSFKVNVPVDKFAELETRLSTVQSSLEALSVLATEALIK